MNNRVDSDSSTIHALELSHKGFCRLRALRRLTVATVALWALASCGQKGPLKLPDDAPETTLPEPATVSRTQ